MESIDELLIARISKKIRRLKADTSVKNRVVVLLGFPASVRRSAELHEYRLFTETVGCEEVSDLTELRAKLVSKIASGSELRDVMWCTYEEFLVVGSDVFSLFLSAEFVEPGIFVTLFPLSYGLGGWGREISQLTMSPDDANDFQAIPQEVFEAFESLYASIAEIEGHWFATYHELPEGRTSLLNESPDPIEVDQMATDHPVHPIGTDESDYVAAVLHTILSQPETSYFEVDDAVTPTATVSAIHRLSGLLRDKTRVLVARRDSRPNTAAILPETIEVLRQHWGFQEFRRIQVYKNVQAAPGDKETIEISQGDIVGTIVQQVEAAVARSPYRDVFVTAPTGSGKSIMFQVPAVHLAEKHDLVTIVVSPLIGLMNDQVQSLYTKDIEIAATINSDIPPTTRSEIQRQIADKKISLLYISPETLLSRSDLSSLIGSRRVGLFVIDEAHIVTTWGKAFRSDYWYLGTYLQKFRKKQPCVIATFTATAIYGGLEDMYKETRDSLNMSNPITYFGYVKRDEIETAIQWLPDYKGKGHEYRRDKYAILLERLRQFLKHDKKILVYFPMIRYINEFSEFVESNGATDVSYVTGKYFGRLTKTEKNDGYVGFKSGTLRIMLATKAFGMGIDIPDIDVVYHFAPTGNVCDYVQEIGRAARQLDRGYAALDYLPGDFGHVNQLHGISSLRKRQLVSTVRKILEISRAEGGRRRLLVRSDDFRHIFAMNAETTDDEVDNKLKTALLILEKDFINRYGYAAILARPRQLFTFEYFEVPVSYEQLNLDSIRRHTEYVDIPGQSDRSIIQVDLKSIWQMHFPDISFAQFKYYFHSDPNHLGLPGLQALRPMIRIRVSLAASLNNSRESLHQILDAAGHSFSSFENPNRQFTVSDFADTLAKINHRFNKNKRLIAETVLDSAYQYCSLMKHRRTHYTWFLQWLRHDGRYQLKSSSYQDFVLWGKHEFDRLCQKAGTDRNNLWMLLDRDNKNEVLNWFTFLGLLEELRLATFDSAGGENPEVFVRINSPFILQRIVDHPDSYENHILNNVALRHRLSVAMLHYLFTEASDSTSFWEKIEDHFLGHTPDAVKSKVFGEQ